MEEEHQHIWGQVGPTEIQLHDIGRVFERCDCGRTRSRLVGLTRQGENRLRETERAEAEARRSDRFVMQLD